MVIVGRALMSLAEVLKLGIDIYQILILAAVIMTWVRPDPYHPLVRFVVQSTEPVFKWIRARLPQSFFSSGIDISPIILFFALSFLENFLVASLNDIGQDILHSARNESLKTMTY